MKNDPFHGETEPQRRRRFGKMDPGVGRSVAFASFLLLFLTFLPMFGFATVCLTAGLLSK